MAKAAIALNEMNDDDEHDDDDADGDDDDIAQNKPGAIEALRAAPTRSHDRPTIGGPGAKRCDRTPRPPSLEAWHRGPWAGNCPRRPAARWSPLAGQS